MDTVRVKVCWEIACYAMAMNWERTLFLVQSFIIHILTFFEQNAPEVEVWLNVILGGEKRRETPTA